MSKNTKQLLLLFIVVSFVYLLFPSPIIASFTKYSSNPILSNGSPTEWDGLDIATPMVLYEGNEYKMWYAGANGPEAHIGFATSTDGVNWTKYTGNPVLNKDLADPTEISINETSVVKVQNEYKMWYMSWVSSTGLGSEIFRIKHATSSDGVAWNRQGIVFRGVNTWEAEGVIPNTVMYINGEFKMWYSGREKYTGVWRIGYANSIDGITWNRQANPVLSANPFLEGTHVNAPSVIFQDGKFHMYYVTGNIVPDNAPYISHATSTDGIVWNKDYSKVLVKGGSLDFDKNAISWPRVLRVNNKLRLYYAGHDGAHWRFGLAEEILPVPYFSQSDPLWGNDIYDHMNTTMASRGCAVTSAAMILKHFNVQNTPGNPDASPNPLLQQIINPGTLNEWMKSRNDSTFKSGATNWALIGTLTKQTHELDPTNPHLEFTYMDTSELDNLLSQNLPVILDLDYPPSPSGAHFVVATKKEGDNYLINDPLDETRTTLNPYYSIIDRIGYFDVTNSDFSYLILAVNPQIDIKLRDEGGMEVGYQFIQDPVVDSVTNSTSGAEQQKMLFLKHPPSGKYTLKISALNNQTFQLDTYLYDQNGDGGLKTFTGIVGPNDTDTFSINIDPENSENSIIQNQITFSTLINDINTSYKLKWIKKPAYKFLLPQAKLAQKFYQKNKKLFVKKILEGMLMQLKIFSELNLVNTEAYKLLKFDIEYLLSVL